jgi:hypothetical protein
VDLEFVRVELNFPMQYNSGASTFLEAVALFEIVDTQERLIPGDSGAPVIAANGTWLGMHVGIASIVVSIGEVRRSIPVAVVLPPSNILGPNGLSNRFSLSAN